MSAFDLETWLPWVLKVLVVLAIAAISRRPEEPEQDDERCFQLVVLGDIGRSPRMQYHALSLARRGCYVNLIGYLESDLHPDIEESDNIHVSSLKTFPAWLKTTNSALFMLYGPLKVFFQLWALWSQMYVRSRHTRWMLVQNPPTIPTLAIALIVCYLRETHLVIDWHNFGYTILSLKLGNSHPLVLVSRHYERLIGRSAYAHLCVSDAMSRALKSECHLNRSVFTLHDRPTSMFRILNENNKLEFLDSLAESFLVPQDSKVPMSDFCLYEAGDVAAKSSKCASRGILQLVKDKKAKLLVSPTSWTPDEDMLLLLDSLLAYDREAEALDLPMLLVVITGKGPQKAAFESKVSQLYSKSEISRVCILTVYLNDINDYARLLGCADLGVSLHTSSSGVDLPMKVLDMFGAGLPVAGWSKFEAWSELVKEGINGLGFGDAAKLQGILQMVFEEDSTVLKRLQKGAMEESKRGWDDEWDPVCETIFGLEDTRRGKRRRE